MNTDYYLEVLRFLDRYSLDAAKLANAAGNELVNKHMSVYPLRVLKSVIVDSGRSWKLRRDNIDESEHRATLIGMNKSHGR